MRVIHTSDWHLGQELHGFDRRVEHDSFLDWLANQLIEQKTDALIITGDVYDSVNPPNLRSTTPVSILTASNNRKPSPSNSAHRRQS